MAKSATTSASRISSCQSASIPERTEISDSPNSGRSPARISGAIQASGKRTRSERLSAARVSRVMTGRWGERCASARRWRCAQTAGARGQPLALPGVFLQRRREILVKLQRDEGWQRPGSPEPWSGAAIDISRGCGGACGAGPEHLRRCRRCQRRSRRSGPRSLRAWARDPAGFPQAPFSWRRGARSGCRSSRR